MVIHCIRCILPIVYIAYKIKKYILFLSLKIDFILANSADTDEMPHHAAFHLGLHCLPKYPFMGSGPKSVKGAVRFAVCCFINK